MKESKILTDIRDKLSRGMVRLWRNNVGRGVMISHPHAQTRQAIITACIELAQQRGGNGARITYGLGVGSGDLIGLRIVEVTPEMVGKRLAVFLSCETKTDTGRESPEQANWREFVNAVGGQAFVARSVEEARTELDNPFTGV